MAKGPHSLSHSDTNKTLRIKAFHGDQCWWRRGETGLFLFWSSLSISFFSSCLRELPSRPRWQMGVFEKWPFGAWHQRVRRRAFESSGWGRQALDCSQQRGGSSGGLRAKRTPINQSVWAGLAIHLASNVPKEREREKEREAEEEQECVRESNLNSTLALVCVCVYKRHEWGKKLQK